MNVGKESSLGYVSWQQRFSYTVSNVHTCTFQWQWRLFSYIASSHFIEFPLFNTTSNNFFFETRLNFLKKIKVVKAAQCLKDGLATRLKLTNIEAVTVPSVCLSYKILSNFEFVLFQLKKDMAVFSKLRFFFCRGIILLVCGLRSQRV